MNVAIDDAYFKILDKEYIIKNVPCMYENDWSKEQIYSDLVASNIEKIIRLIHENKIENGINYRDALDLL